MVQIERERRKIGRKNKSMRKRETEREGGRRGKGLRICSGMWRE